MKNKNFIVYSFQSINDPLLKGLMLEYMIKTAQNNSSYIFHLISHEQESFKLSEIQAKKLKDELLKINIYWYPINYISGKYLLLKKLINFIQSFIICYKINKKHNPHAIIGFLSIAGAFSFIISKILKLKLGIFCFEPHSGYMLDFKRWKKYSLKYILLNKFEYWQIKYATHMVLPTNYSIDLANKINSKSKKYLVPISIDTDKFTFSVEGRQRIRNEINANEKFVIIYTGKFGGIYYTSSEVLLFFSNLLKTNSKYFLYIITPHFDEVVKNICSFDIPKGSYFISKEVPYDELKDHISASDIGLIAIPSLPSQKYRTPVKTGIYLSCGVPYIINKGIAEDDILAQQSNVGLVVDSLSLISFDNLNQEIISLLSEEISDLRNRCRKVAIENRGLQNSISALESILKEI